MTYESDLPRITVDMNRFVKIALDLANLADRAEGKNEFAPILEELGLGYRAFSNYMRRGARACIDIQERYSSAEEWRRLAEIGEEEAKDFLKECFGDEEPYTINDKDKARIIALCNQIKKEWDEEDKKEQE